MYYQCKIIQYIIFSLLNVNINIIFIHFFYALLINLVVKNLYNTNFFYKHQSIYKNSLVYFWIKTNTLFKYIKKVLSYLIILIMINTICFLRN